MELEEARRSAANLFGEIGRPSNRRLIEVGRREGQGRGFLKQLLDDAKWVSASPVTPLWIYAFA